MMLKSPVRTYLLPWLYLILLLCKSSGSKVLHRHGCMTAALVYTRLHLVCPVGKYIEVLSARFGVSAYGLCISTLQDCFQEAPLPVHCCHRQRCLVDVENITVKPCGGWASYYQVKYICRPAPEVNCSNPLDTGQQESHNIAYFTKESLSPIATNISNRIPNASLGAFGTSNSKTTHNITKHIRTTTANAILDDLKTLTHSVNGTISFLPKNETVHGLFDRLFQFNMVNSNITEEEVHKAGPSDKNDRLTDYDNDDYDEIDRMETIQHEETTENPITSSYKIESTTPTNILSMQSKTTRAPKFSVHRETVKVSVKTHGRSSNYSNTERPATNNHTKVQNSSYSSTTMPATTKSHKKETRSERAIGDDRYDHNHHQADHPHKNTQAAMWHLFYTEAPRVHHRSENKPRGRSYPVRPPHGSFKNHYSALTPYPRRTISTDLDSDELPSYNDGLLWQVLAKISNGPGNDEDSGENAKGIHKPINPQHTDSAVTIRPTRSNSRFTGRHFEREQSSQKQQTEENQGDDSASSSREQEHANTDGSYVNTGKFTPTARPRPLSPPRTNLPLQPSRSRTLKDRYRMRRPNTDHSRAHKPPSYQTRNTEDSIARYPNVSLRPRRPDYIKPMPTRNRQEEPEFKRPTYDAPGQWQTRQDGPVEVRNLTTSDVNFRRHFGANEQTDAKRGWAPLGPYGEDMSDKRVADIELKNFDVTTMATRPTTSSTTSTTIATKPFRHRPTPTYRPIFRHPISSTKHPHPPQRRPSPRFKLVQEPTLDEAPRKSVLPSDSRIAVWFAEPKRVTQITAVTALKHDTSTHNPSLEISSSSSAIDDDVKNVPTGQEEDIWSTNVAASRMSFGTLLTIACGEAAMFVVLLIALAICLRRSRKAYLKSTRKVYIRYDCDDSCSNVTNTTTLTSATSQSHFHKHQPQNKGGQYNVLQGCQTKRPQGTPSKDPPVYHATHKKSLPKPLPKGNRPSILKEHKSPVRPPKQPPPPPPRLDKLNDPNPLSARCLSAAVTDSPSKPTRKYFYEEACTAFNVPLPEPEAQSNVTSTPVTSPNDKRKVRTISGSLSTQSNSTTFNGGSQDDGVSEGTPSHFSVDSFETVSYSNESEAPVLVDSRLKEFAESELQLIDEQIAVLFQGSDVGFGGGLSSSSYQY